MAEREMETVVRGLRYSWSQVAGDESDDPTHVVFIHGFQNDRSAWDPLAERLSRAGRRFTLIDLPGCGRSEAPATWQRSTIGELARDVAELIRAARLSWPVLIGHSLGGAIAIQAAIDEPELCSGLVLFAPASTRGLDFVPDDAFESLVHPTIEDQRALLRAAFHRPPPPDLLAQLESVIQKASPQHIEGAARSMRDFRPESLLATVTAPVLLVVGGPGSSRAAPQPPGDVEPLPSSRTARGARRRTRAVRRGPSVVGAARRALHRARASAMIDDPVVVARRDAVDAVPTRGLR